MSFFSFRIFMVMVSCFFLTNIIVSSIPKKLCDSNVYAKDSKKNDPKKKTPSQSNHLTLPKSAFERFPVPKEIRHAVDFWKMVYTKYDKKFEIFHDTENLRVIYSVINFTDLYDNPNLDKEGRLKILRPRLDAEEQRIKAMLLKIHENRFQPEKLSTEEKRIFDLFKEDPNDQKFLEAADEKRIRAQTGIKNKFLEAINISGAYMGEFEEIFKGYDLPVELSRLAFVESMFNLKARSKVGASGVWQFMPETAKIYGLTINNVVDDRNDPFTAAHAAARLLKANYEALGTWQLAMNAYNSGRGTLSKAVETVGTTDIAKIILNYRGGIYGFASRNFVPSFLAILEITHDYPKYVGQQPVLSPIVYENFILDQPTSMPELLKHSQLDEETFLNLNPSFTENVIAGKQKIPEGYLLKIPVGSKEQFSKAQKKIRVAKTSSKK